jgi:plasmid maintenance system antidote protein VapI
MEYQLSILKGIHPGFFIERELRKRQLPVLKFALSLEEQPQTIVSITKGKRKMNTRLALKIEKALDLEEGYLMILQVYHDIEEEKRKLNTSHPDLSKLRPVLFWDTKIETINWMKYQTTIIKRVFERGNQEEKEEITRFYGEDIIAKTLQGNKFPNLIPITSFYVVLSCI